MIDHVRRWWRDLGYCNGRRNGEFRTWGLRPFGKRWFWFTIDDSGTARRVTRAEPAPSAYAPCGACGAGGDTPRGVYHRPDRTACDDGRACLERQRVASISWAEASDLEAHAKAHDEALAVPRHSEEP